mmetsp:Transcript_34030/g.105786  ORF Transcript_34030/g.105786 Transcript_34030/m.105786 type:complete len:159 (+) Transcript_34030:1-477(+)
MQTPDVARLEAFYTRVLGFRALQRPFDGIFSGSWLQGGGTMIHIMAANAYPVIQELLKKHDPARLASSYAAPPRARPAAAEKPLDGRVPLEDHLAFAVRDMGATRRRLKALGIECFDIRNKIENHVWIKDPDGRIIELTEDAAAPPPKKAPAPPAAKL